jgi:hypothetical protein
MCRIRVSTTHLRAPQGRNSHPALISKLEALQELAYGAKIQQKHGYDRGRRQQNHHLVETTSCDKTRKKETLYEGSICDHDTKEL